MKNSCYEPSQGEMFSLRVVVLKDEEQGEGKKTTGTASFGMMNGSKKGRRLGQCTGSCG